MTPAVEETAPDFETLLCNGETFWPAALSESVGNVGCVLVFDGFFFSAIARNWWTRYATRGWDALDGVPVYGVVRDSPYSIN